MLGGPWQQAQPIEALAAAEAMSEWLDAAALQLDDPEVMDMAALMGEYVLVLGG
ncbi:hypothetical protein [Enhygromyxa salina]|uniref:Uncharacterized protein n=1 Tax=Enhygromyxa salina TaxID=215803 RepID=A0A2S9YPP6_9BACT|nr:hypothetical protein [Enhygromyxa salina]PRQ07063.1 hypothetical protein ENSA7_32020 [Enhygromyxa salina]